MAATATKSSLGEVKITTTIIMNEDGRFLIIVCGYTMKPPRYHDDGRHLMIGDNNLLLHKERQSETAAVRDVNRKEEVTVYSFENNLNARPNKDPI